MNDIEKKVRSLEYQMTYNKCCMDQQMFLLQEYFSQPMFMPLAIISSFCLGYLVTRLVKKSRVLRVLLIPPIFLLKVLKKVYTLSAFMLI